MRKVLIDLNIVLDMLTMRQDHEAAAAVFDKCVKRKIKGYICSHEITTLSYFLEREKYEIKKRNKIINMLLDNLSVLTAHEKILRDALNSEIDDYEDAVIDELSYNEEVDFIVTRDMKDFKKSKNSIHTAIEAIEIIDS
jgi:predicted nucleic-acid-binding protein